MATAEADVLRRLTESDAGQAMLNEQAAELVKERKGQVAEIERLREELLEQIPALNTAEEQARAKLERAKEAEKSALDAWRIAETARMSAHTEKDQLVGKLEGKLLQSADPAIHGFVREMSREFDATRKSGSTNYEATNARLAAITAARRKAEVLKLQALTAGEVSSRIEALRRGLPAVT